MNLEQLFVDIVRNLHISDYHLQVVEYSYMLPTLWYRQSRDMEDQEHAGILLMNVVKGILEDKLPYIHNYLRLEYEQFRPHLYTLNPATMFLLYECKLITADLLKNPTRGAYSKLFIKFFKHPVFRPETASSLSCGSLNGTSLLMTDKMKQ